MIFIKNLHTDARAWFQYRNCLAFCRFILMAAPYEQYHIDIYNVL
jgi:hypothetical protein